MRLNVIFVVLAVVILAAFAVLYFVIAGGSGDEPENGLPVEEQSPSIEQKSAETPTQTVDETSAPESQEEPSVPENVEAEESASPADSGGESATPSAALEADAPDAFAVQLQEAIQELDQIAQDLKDRFPGSEFAAGIADMFTDLGADLARLDAESRQQNLPRQERIAALRGRYAETGKKFDELERDPSLSDTADEVLTYLGGVPCQKSTPCLKLGNEGETHVPPRLSNRRPASFDRRRAVSPMRPRWRTARLGFRQASSGRQRSHDASHTIQPRAPLI